VAGPTAVLFNHETSSYETVPAELVGSALSSGKYTAPEGSTLTRAEGGVVTRPIGQLGAAATQGETDAGDVIATEGAIARRAEQSDLVSDRALTFVEGAGDALTLGLLHGTSDIDELRREVNGGSALLGQLAGTAMGMATPSLVSGVAKTGSALGRAAGGALLRDIETGFGRTVARGIEEASINASLMAASGFGHQVVDAVVADKPFAAEAIVHEAGVGALLGFGAGWLGSSFSQLAKSSRSAVEASGVAIKESKAALEAVAGMTGAWDEAVETHARRYGVLQVLADEGHIPSGNLEAAGQAVREATRARDALRALDAEAALGGDTRAYQTWRNAVEKYDAAARNLDKQMTPSLEQRASLTPVEVGARPPMEPPIHPMDIDAAEAARGSVSTMSQELDAGMRGGSQEGWTHLKGKSAADLTAAYESLHGRPFEPGPGAPTTGVTGEENLGGAQSATSELGTNPGRGRRASSPSGLAPIGERAPLGNDTVVDPRVERFNKPLGRVRDVHDTALDVSGHETPPREVLEAGEPPTTPRDNGQKFIDLRNSKVAQLEAGTAEAGTGAPAKPRDGSGKAAVRDYLREWFSASDAAPRTSPGDAMAAKLSEALDSLTRAGGTRLDSVGALELGGALGLKTPATSLGARLDQVWSLSKVGQFAADEARGVKTPMRKGIIGALQRYTLRRGGRAAASAAAGGLVAGPLGAAIGYALTSTSFAGHVASSAGKLAKTVAIVGDALLQGRRATVAVRAVAGNRPYQYSEAGPLKDPVERIQEVQRMAANPGAIKAMVTKQLGDLALTSPELAERLTNTAVNQISAIALNAPAITFTPLGVPIKPTGTALTRFQAFENAMHDLEGVLNAVKAGSASKEQISALHVGFPAVHESLMRQVLGNAEAMKKLDNSGLAAISRTLGVPLTRAAADPAYVSRMQQGWDSPRSQPANKAQAFKITADRPTPVQSANSGRAPGNEPRKP